MDASSFMNNPMAIQRSILNDYERRVEGDDQPVVVDPNNTFSFLLEAFGRTVAEASNATDAKLNSLYPKRAMVTQDLYHHLSDFDYVGFYSTPAPLKMSLMLHKTFIINNAVPVPDTNYSLVVIPADTRFTVGRYTMGLYYPIHIRVNNITKTVSAVYDTSETNPLYSLDTNSISVKNTSFGGIELISLEFTTHQFSKHIFNESIKPELGFTKKYKHPDRFYAVRITDKKSGKELSYTMSDQAYDLQRPTVKLRVYPEEQSISLSIPQIYLNEGKISNQIRVEILTTLGALDTSLAHLELDDIEANFALDVPGTELKYTQFLKNIPTLILVPAETRLVGGSDGYTFNQMKDRVIYRSGDVKVPTTRMELEKFIQDRGFDNYQVKVDNLTDRRYHVHRPVKLGDEELSIIDGSLTLSFEDQGFNSNIIRHQDQTITILPTTVFKYSSDTQTFLPLTDEQQKFLNEATPRQLVDHLNDSPYYVSPYHYSINAETRYARCTPYDLLTTYTNQVVFEEENIHLSTQLNVVSTDVKHLGSGSNSYQLRVGVQRSPDIANTPSDDINIFLTITTPEGWVIGKRGTYSGTYDGVDVYDFKLETNYQITDDRIVLTNFMRRSTEEGNYHVGLTGKMRIATFIKKSQYPDVPQNHNIMNQLISNQPEQWLAVSLQQFDYRIGENLGDVIDSNFLTTWRGQEYQRHPVDVPLTYEYDVYETNADGTLKYEIDAAGEVILNKLHAAGDPHLDSETGEQLIKHREGDLVLDVNGSPIPLEDRIREFTFELTGYGYEHLVMISEFRRKLAAELQAYHTTVREMNQQVLENTIISFRPMATAGRTIYKLNNLTSVSMNLEIALQFTVFVPQSVLEDPKLVDDLRRQSERIVNDQIAQPVISVAAIMAQLQEDLGEFVNSVDFVSLNGDKEVQTLTNMKNDRITRLGHELTITADGHIDSIPKLTLEFKPFDT